MGALWQCETVADLRALAQRIVEQTASCKCPDERHHNAMHDLAHDLLTVLPEESEGGADGHVPGDPRPVRVFEHRAGGARTFVAEFTAPQAPFLGVDGDRNVRGHEKAVWLCDCQPTPDGQCAAKANPEDCGARRAVPVDTTLAPAAVADLAALQAALAAITALTTAALADRRRGCPTYGLVSAARIQRLVEEATHD